jgi:hypothetical protein
LSKLDRSDKVLRIQTTVAPVFLFLNRSSFLSFSLMSSSYPVSPLFIFASFFVQNVSFSICSILIENLFYSHIIFFLWALFSIEYSLYASRFLDDSWKDMEMLLTKRSDCTGYSGDISGNGGIKPIFSGSGWWVPSVLWNSFWSRRFLIESDPDKYAYIRVQYGKWTQTSGSEYLCTVYSPPHLGMWVWWVWGG